jgi:prepilin-type N-terminal cleavage/methylation domain-containing protein
MHRRHGTRGFTLVELLVGVAIFSMLMIAVATLFTSSIRTARTTEAKVDMSGMAQGALAIMERDLSGSFTSRDFGEYYQFFGSPFGFMTVGLAPGGGLQRTTWVVTRRDWVAPEDLKTLDPDDDTGMAADVVVTTEEDGTGAYIEKTTFILLRYVEPDVEDLDSFFFWDSNGNPVSWTWNDVTLGPGGEDGSYADDWFGGIETFLNSEGESFTAEEQSELYNAHRRHLWLLMLAGYPEIGGTYGRFPQFWAEVWPNGEKFDPASDQPNYMDYVVAEGIVHPDDLRSFDVELGIPWFRYAQLGQAGNEQALTAYWSTVFNNQLVRTSASALDPPLGHFPGFAYYEGVLSDGTLVGLGDPLQPRLPDAVQVNMTFLREGPLVGAPDIRHRMKQVIDVPTAFSRSVP